MASSLNKSMMSALTSLFDWSDKSLYGALRTGGFECLCHTRLKQMRSGCASLVLVWVLTGSHFHQAHLPHSKHLGCRTQLNTKLLQVRSAPSYKFSKFHVAYTSFYPVQVPITEDTCLTMYFSRACGP